MPENRPHRSFKLFSRSQICALALLREASACLRDDGTAPAIDRRPFVCVAQICATKGVAFGVPGNGFVTPSESLILAAIALAMTGRGRLRLDHDFDVALRDCAMALRAAGIRLPLNRPMRTLLERHDWATVEPVTPAGAARRDRTLVPPRAGSVRARAVELATGRAMVSTSEFAAIGVSRQYLARICADGLLERVRFGGYRVAAGIAPLTSGGRTES